MRCRPSWSPSFLNLPITMPQQHAIVWPAIRCAARYGRPSSPAAQAAGCPLLSSLLSPHLLMAAAWRHSHTNGRSSAPVVLSPFSTTTYFKYVDKLTGLRICRSLGLILPYTTGPWGRSRSFLLFSSHSLYVRQSQWSLGSRGTLPGNNPRNPHQPSFFMPFLRP